MMKHKKCPQCKNLISATAPTCLYCGRPNKFVTHNYVKSKWDKEYKKNKINFLKVYISNQVLFTSIIVIVILIIILYK